MDSSAHGISLDTSVSMPLRTSEDGETPTTKLPQEETLGWASTEQGRRRSSTDSAAKAKMDEHNRRASYQSSGSRRDCPSSRSSSGKWIYMTSSESSGDIRISVLYDGATEKPIIPSPDRKKSIPSIKRTSPGRARFFSEPVPLDDVDDVDNESEEAPPIIALPRRVSGAFREETTPPPEHPPPSPPASAGGWDLDPRSPSVDYFCQRNLIDQLVGIESRLRSLEVNRLQDIVRNDIHKLLERVEAIAETQRRPVQAPAYVSVPWKPPKVPAGTRVWPGRGPPQQPWLRALWAQDTVSSSRPKKAAFARFGARLDSSSLSLASAPFALALGVLRPRSVSVATRHSLPLSRCTPVPLPPSLYYLFEYHPAAREKQSLPARCCPLSTPSAVRLSDCRARPCVWDFLPFGILATCIGRVHSVSSWTTHIAHGAEG